MHAVDFYNRLTQAQCNGREAAIAHALSLVPEILRLEG